MDWHSAGGLLATIDHVGIAVKSIAAARGLYEALGLSVVEVEEIPEEQARTARIPVGESRIDLIEATGEDSPVGCFLAEYGEGLHHVALHVDDISGAMESLKAKGVHLLSDDLRIGAGGRLYFFIHPSSSAGVLVEICQDSIADV
jgi:methylmalonyl-CoA epimerase